MYADTSRMDVSYNKIRVSNQKGVLDFRIVVDSERRPNLPALLRVDRFYRERACIHVTFIAFVFLGSFLLFYLYGPSRQRIES